MIEIEFCNDGPCGAECTGDCDECPNGLFFATTDASFLADVDDSYDDGSEGWFK